jgi:hypothetical protein
LSKKSGVKDKYRPFSFEQKNLLAMLKHPRHAREKKIQLMTKWALFDLFFSDQGELSQRGLDLFEKALYARKMTCSLLD